MGRLGHHGKTWDGAGIWQQRRVAKYALLGWLVATMGLAFLVRFPFMSGLVGRLLGRLGVLGFLLRIRLVVIQFFAAPSLFE